MAELGHFFSGFAKSFGQGLQQGQARKLKEDERKARLKLIELQMKAAEQKQDELDAQATVHGPRNNPLPGVEGPPEPGVGIAERLAAKDPMMIQDILAASSDPLKAMKGIREQQDAAKNSALRDQIMAAAGFQIPGAGASTGAGGSSFAPATSSPDLLAGAPAGTQPITPRTGGGGALTGMKPPSFTVGSDGRFSVRIDPEDERKKSPGEITYESIEAAAKSGDKSKMNFLIAQHELKTGIRLSASDLLDHQKTMRAASKDFMTMRSFFDKGLDGAKSASAGGDITLIFAFMKILDPNSSVREGEAATVRNAGSVPERIMNMYNNAVGGEILQTTQRQDIVNQMGDAFDDARKTQGQMIDGVKEYADRNEIDWRNMVPKEVLLRDLVEGNRGLGDQASPANEAIQAGKKVVGGLGGFIGATENEVNPQNRRKIDLRRPL